MTTPPNGNGNTWRDDFANFRNATGKQASNGGGRGDGGARRGGGDRHYHVHVGGNPDANGQANAGPGGGFFSRGAGGGNRPGHSPLADPQFFNSTDVRNYCDQARSVFLQLSFELAGAAEVLQAALAQVPDPQGRGRMGSRSRARRVSKKLKKTADDVRDAAKNAVATYAAFQREFEPELAPYNARRAAGRRRFDFTL
ncbi:plasmid transfer protein TraA [Streptomyces cylindrosporus]|uniref:Sporulation protein SsgA n=1 Tax=Streptomyces cylindrosporus TaxID=2927583 RepID=A0ABS9YG94_9ACTN|nr:plasmid transfer protein TraA [Streptomyces cylindrosporus]MCI3276257.1 sporulation protein SsgA [Streptomyces cylindrosporus]